MSGAHTPGPWGTLTYANHELQTDFALVSIGTRVHMIGYSDEDKANARLIAAAPDLLAALQWVMSATGEQLTSAFEAAQDAIDKATGAAS